MLVVLSAVGLAQSRSGNLYGIIKGSGRALADMHVRLSREGSSQPVAERVTDASGRFRFAGLTWGSGFLPPRPCGGRLAKPANPHRASLRQHHVCERQALAIGERLEAFRGTGHKPGCLVRHAVW
jgi:hypothetical protein